MYLNRKSHAISKTCVTFLKSRTNDRLFRRMATQCNTKTSQIVESKEYFHTTTVRCDEVLDAPKRPTLLWCTPNAGRPGFADVIAVRCSPQERLTAARRRSSQIAVLVSRAICAAVADMLRCTPDMIAFSDADTMLPSMPTPNSVTPLTLSSR